MNNLLKELEKERDVALKHEHDNDHSWGYLNGIEKAIEIVKNCSIPAVGRMLAISFAKWLRDNTVADGSPKLLFRPDMKRYTIEELFDLYTLIAE